MTGEDDRGERPRRSWSEIDRLRDQPRGRRDERASRGPADSARARDAAQQYLKKLDRTLFAKGAGGASEADRLATDGREALGTPRLAAACHAYLDAVGPPVEAPLVAAFLDAPDRDLRLAALASLREALGAGGLALTTGLRAQLRSLAEGLDDELAEAAEAALEAG